MTEMEVNVKGAFVDSLKRNFRDIRNDRAQNIAEEAEVKLRRNIEDLDLSLRDLKRKRENALDLSPANATSLKPAQDFDADAWATKEIDYIIKIHNLEMVLKGAKERYNYLFKGE